MSAATKPRREVRATTVHAARAAGVIWLHTQLSQDEHRARSHNCLSCKHATDIKGDPRRGWCQQWRFMVSNAFPVICPAFEREQ